MVIQNNRRAFLQNSLLASLGLPFLHGFSKALEKTSKSSVPTALKITDAKCGYIRNGHSLLVKIYSNQDIWGCGEGVDATPGTYHLVKEFGARLKNKNPLNIHRPFEDLRRKGFFPGAQSGMYVAVLNAIETALLSIFRVSVSVPYH